jgi:hypothetical protein
MYTNAKISEQVSVLGTIDPVSQGVGSVTTSWIPVSGHERLMALIQTGVLGASATVDAKLLQAKDASGTGSKDVTSKAIAQIVKASGDNKQALINLRAEELDTNGGFSYVALSITVGAAASLVGGSVLGAVARQYPASLSNQAGVAQIV